FNGVKTVFECTGGKFSSSAVNQAISCIDREGTIVLMGVTEELVPINTRDVLEKGIKIFGSSRSNTSEFTQLMQEFKKVDYQQALREIVPKQSIPIKTASDMEEAMNLAAGHRGQTKVYLSLKWNNDQ